MRGRVSGSFRDPSGFVFEAGGEIYRHVAEKHAGHYDHLLSSGLYEALVSRGLLISHEEADSSLSPSPGAHRVLRPEVVDFISYPYEWCFGQLQDAALKTLEIQSIALDHGMSMRDASAYNIQFHRGRPTLIDTLSFERLPPGKPWIAYRQFCQHFLAPLALASHGDARMVQMMRGHIDGIPLDLASSLLPLRTRWRPGLGMHIHSHARAQKRHESSDGSPSRSFSERSFKALISSLTSAVSRLGPSSEPTTWSEYYEEAASYSEEGLGHKKEVVAGYLDTAGPASVWDLGANVGVFSRLASSRKIPTVSFDVDYGCLEASYRRVKSEGEEHLLPLFCDLTNPAPSLGWALAERDSLTDRGPADLAMALALVHHLAIGNNVPLDAVAGFFRSICRWLIVEFVPKSDPKVELLLKSREDIFDDYTPDGFEKAFLESFEVVSRTPVRSSERVLYLMRGK